jgi:xanthine dehydrogenase accessory factor
VSEDINAHGPDTECAVAHGDAPQVAGSDRHLVAVYASPVATYLLSWGLDLGFATCLVEPDPDRVTDDLRRLAGHVHTDPGDVEVASISDVVVTDHHRGDLGETMAPLVTATPRWIGIMGSPRHVGPHIEALRAQGLDDEAIATVHRPIGLDIGSKAPAEIALSTLAGLLADRAGRSGGFPRAQQRTLSSA